MVKEGGNIVMDYLTMPSLNFTSEVEGKTYTLKPEVVIFIEQQH